MKKRKLRLKKLKKRGKYTEKTFDFLSAFQAEIFRLAEEKNGKITFCHPSRQSPQKANLEKNGLIPEQPSEELEEKTKPITPEKTGPILKTGVSWADLADSSDDDD